jgi:DnaJ-domain-containing protein 1
MGEQGGSKRWMKWLIVGALVYFVLPWDLIPDFLGLAGRIDDLLLFALLGWRYRDEIRRVFATPGTGAHESAEIPSASSSDVFDPYEILGVPRSSSPDQIQSAYRARMMEYHPDKVAHLGAELQELALEKSQSIERAYRELRK